MARLDKSGTPLWGMAVGGAGDDNLKGVAVAGASAVIVTGYFSGAAQFGKNALTSKGLEDLVVSKLGPASP